LVVQWFQQVANPYFSQLKECLELRGNVLAEQALKRKYLVDTSSSKSKPTSSTKATATPLFDSPLFAAMRQRRQGTLTTMTMDYTEQQQDDEEEEEEKVRRQIQQCQQQREIHSRLDEARQAKTMLGELGRLFDKMKTLSIAPKEKYWKRLKTTSKRPMMPMSRRDKTN
jgi:hypothetical protein